MRKKGSPQPHNINRRLTHCAIGCLGFLVIGVGILCLLWIHFQKTADARITERAAHTTWHTYTHTGLGFSFEYPDYYEFAEQLSTDAVATEEGFTATAPNFKDCSAGTVSPMFGDCWFKANFYHDDFYASWNVVNEVSGGTPVVINGHDAQKFIGVEHGDLYRKPYTSYVFRLHDGNLIIRFYDKPLNALEEHIINSVTFTE